MTSDSDSLLLLQTALDSVPAHVAILDFNGIIIRVNAAWVRYGHENNLKYPNSGIGQCYLSCCTQLPENQDALIVAKAIETILLSDQPERFEHDYLCTHPADPKRDRWFHLTLQPFQYCGKTHIMMSHEDITNRYVIERYRELLSEALNQTLSGVIITDASGDICYVNPGFSVITGYQAEEVLGRNPRFLRSSLTSMETYSTLWETIRSGKTWRGTISNRRKNGQTYWTRQTISPMLDTEAVITHYVAVQEDITSPHQDALLHSGLIESSPDAYVSIDLDGIVKDWSLKAERLFGKSRQDAMGTDFINLVFDSERGKIFRSQLSLLNMGKSHYFGQTQREILRDRNNNEFNAEITLVPVDLDSEWRLTGFIRNVTESVLLERQLLQAQKMEAIGQLAGSMAHDFNNVLGIISGSLDLIKEEIGSDNRYVTIAKDAILRASQSISSLLSVARKRQIDPELIHIEQIIKELMPIARQSIGRGIELQTSCAENLPQILVEVSALYNAIINLVINAKDAIGRKRGKIIIYCYLLWIDREFSHPGLSLPNGQYVVIGVDDSGAGMTAEVADKAFDPFFTTKGEAKGTGLGLAMVYQFCRRSGGLARISSQPGKGSNIQMIFPVAKKKAPSPKTGPIQVQPAMRILLVDTDLHFLSEALQMLIDRGHKVIATSHPNEVLTYIADEKIDFIVIDETLISTSELMSRARNKHNSSTRIVVTSANPGKIKSDLIYKNSIILQKPVKNLSSLAKAIEQPPE